MSLILIVEDDVDLVETYTDLLEARGHAVANASSAAEAIALISITPPAVIVLDLGLPGGSGLRVLEHARSSPLLKNVKIIVVTGHSEMANFGLAEAADVILTKPISNSQLRMIVERFVDPIKLAQTPVSAQEPAQPVLHPSVVVVPTAPLPLTLSLDTRG
ncbi:MAG: response regulator [Chloroflexi bacterium]|nr:response regulator [Chloroflexota bacterium]